MIPAVKELFCIALVRVLPEPAELFADRPSTRGLQIHLLQGFKALPLSIFEVLRIEEPQLP